MAGTDGGVILLTPPTGAPISAHVPTGTITKHLHQKPPPPPLTSRQPTTHKTQKSVPPSRSNHQDWSHQRSASQAVCAATYRLVFLPLKDLVRIPLSPLPPRRVFLHPHSLPEFPIRSLTSWKCFSTPAWSLSSPPVIFVDPPLFGRSTHPRNHVHGSPFL